MNNHGQRHPSSDLKKIPSPGRYLLKRSMMKAGFPLQGPLKDFLDSKMKEPGPAGPPPEPAFPSPSRMEPHPASGQAQEQPAEPEQHVVQPPEPPPAPGPVHRQHAEPPEPRRVAKTLIDPEEASSLPTFLLPFESYLGSFSAFAPEQVSDMYVETMRIIDGHIRRMMSALPGTFYPGLRSEFLTTGSLFPGKDFTVCTPIQLKHGIAAPVLVDVHGMMRPRLFFAFKSECDYLWRPRSWCMPEEGASARSHGLFEFGVPLHWKLQELLDRLLSRPLTGRSAPGIALPKDLFYSGSEYWGRIHEDTESQLGRCLSDREFEPHAPGKVVFSWHSGRNDLALGRSVHLVVRSSSGLYDYLVCASCEGVFLQAVYPGPQNTDASMTINGIMNPVYSYRENPGEFRSPIDYPVITCVDAFHPPPASPTYRGDPNGWWSEDFRNDRIRAMAGSIALEFANALADLPRLLRSGNDEAVRIRIQQLQSGRAPLMISAVLSPRIDDKILTNASLRLDELLMAYDFKIQGDLDYAIQKFGLSAREAAVISSYAKHFGAQLRPAPGNIIYDRLFRLAIQYAKDQSMSQKAKTLIDPQRR